MTPSRHRLPTPPLAAALAAALAVAVPASATEGGATLPAPAGPAGSGPGPAVCPASPAAAAGAGGPALAAGRLDPRRVSMAATRRARGGGGTMLVRLASSAAGVALARDGSYRYHVEVAVEDLPRLSGGTYVVWAATPELDRHVKLGTLGPSGRVAGEVTWNKFMVFVTAERSADVEAWSQDILLSARSPSGRMHTMAGHGPFSGEPCLDPRP